MQLPFISFKSILCLSLWLSLASNAIAVPGKPPFPTATPTPPQLSSNSYLLIDYNSDKILAENDANKQVEPASLTKVMTMYVVDHELKNKKIKLEDNVKISKKAWRAQGSRMFLEVGSEVPVEQIIKGIIIQSGNDASIAIAEHIAGSESAFADLMNAYAQMLGMTNTHFVNATGLPHPEHYTSAKDMALLAKALIKEFPESYDIYSEKEFSYNNIRQYNRNRLLWRNNYVDGIKTGHTDSAGHCLVASGTKAGMRLIAVVLGAKNDDVRTNETNKLLTWGFRFYQTKRLYKAGEPLQDIDIWMGDEKNLGVGLEQDLYITIPQGQYDYLNAGFTYPKLIKAPMNKGDALGNLTLTLNDEPLLERPIVALSTIEKGGVWSRFKDYIRLAGLAIWKKMNG